MVCFSSPVPPVRSSARRQLAERLWQTKPDLRVLLMSGHADDAVLTRGVERSESAFLQKPFSRLALARRLRELLDPA